MMKNLNRTALSLTYLFILLTMVMASTANAKSAKRRRIIKHRLDADPFVGLDQDTIDQATPETIMHGVDWDFTVAMLSDEDTPLVNGVVTDDEEIRLPDNELMPTNNRRLRASNSTEEIEVLFAFEMPVGIPQCDATVNDDIKMFIIDSVFVNSKYLSHPVEKLISYVGDVVCNSHGGWVASTINEMIPYGTMKFVSAGVFNCQGSGYTSSIIGSINAVLEDKKKNPKVKYIINYSGGGRAHAASDDAFAEAEKQGVAAYVAAGNNAWDCRYTSPARVASTSTVSSIGASCGNKPCSYTNYESSDPSWQCVTVNLPGCVSVLNPRDGKRNGVCGTSFASPEAAARHAIAQANNPKLNKDQIKELLKEGVHKVAVPAGAHFSGQWDVIDRDFVCPKGTALFEGTKSYYKPRSGQFLEWFNASDNNGVFCVTFEANTRRGGLGVGTKKTITSEAAIIAKIGTSRNLKQSKKPWSHMLIDGDETLDSRNTGGRIIGGKFREFKVSVEDSNFLVQYKKKQKTITLLNGDIDSNPTEIGFTSYGGRVKVRNAKLCNA